MNFSTVGSGSLAHILEGCTTPEREKKIILQCVLWSCSVSDCNLQLSINVQEHRKKEELH